MLKLSVNIDRAEADALLDGVRRGLADRGELHRDVGLSVEHRVKEHLRKLPGRTFYKQAAESTYLAEYDADGATVVINKRGIALRFYGGVVVPSGKTSEVTGKAIKNLSIPLNDAPPVAEFGGALAWIPNRKGGRVTGYLVDGENYTISRGPNKGKQGVRVKQGGSLRYILAKKTVHKEDPKVLPSDEDMIAAARESVELYLEALDGL